MHIFYVFAYIYVTCTLKNPKSDWINTISMKLSCLEIVEANFY